MITSEQTTISAAPVGGARDVSWGAIFSGVFIAAAAYVALLILGTGLGFTVVSAWNFQDYTTGAIGGTALVWIVLTQIISLGGGGYVAGRLASEANNQRNQGTHFYDIAHGLLVWALSSMMVALLLGTVTSSLFSGGLSLVTAISKGAGAGMGAGATYALAPGYDNFAIGGENDPVNYALDLLLRPESAENAHDASSSPTMSNEQKKEIARIFMTSVKNNSMSEEDKKYVAQLVTQFTGMPQTEALKRVDATIEQLDSALNKANERIKETFDNARHATAAAALWSFATLLFGALVTAGAACYGGNWRQRRFARPKKQRNVDE